MVRLYCYSIFILLIRFKAGLVPLSSNLKKKTDIQRRHRLSKKFYSDDETNVGRYYQKLKRNGARLYEDFKLQKKK